MPARCYVSFIGGPFDGYRRTIPLAADEMLALAKLPVSRSTLRLFAGQPARDEAPVTSIAVYRQEFSELGCCYRFIRAMSPARAPHAS